VPAAILVAGLTAALVIYLTATNAPDRGGESSEDSKRYLRQMESYGGKATVAATELRQWLDGLWHGRTLAFTVASLSLLAAAVAYVALAPLPPPPDGDDDS
jgi:hypothetical protein